MATFVVHARRTPETLLRVLSLFHRRALEVERIVAERSPDREILSITITFVGDENQAQRMEANLWKVEDVIHVEAQLEG